MAWGFINLHDAVSEMAYASFWRDIIIEIIGTFFLLAMNAMAASPLDHIVDRPFICHALTAGLYVYVIIEMFGHIQFAAINPMVCILFVATKRISFIKGNNINTLQPYMFVYK